ncbi:MAG: hypothetical protein LKI92_01965 [Schleiferilactobacillus harbinensis]|nr:hypothetical protein [Schleiferilactobacillus harbinensis]MCI1913478.1 hypothetical protein [Schleiferilactobacillus harbinensis]
MKYKLGPWQKPFLEYLLVVVAGFAFSWFVGERGRGFYVVGGSVAVAFAIVRGPGAVWRVRKELKNKEDNQ